MALPNKLYKYQPFNTISLSNLSNLQIYFCNPTKFNDPYDCDLDITFKDLDRDDYKKFIKDYFSEISGPEVTAEILYKILENDQLVEGYKNSVDKGLNKVLDELKDKFLSSRGIASLSALKDNIIMWGHYADGHRGFCLEFDTSHDPFDSAKEVIYSDKIPELDASMILPETDSDSNHIVRPLTTKYSHWEYEKEYRLIHNAHSIEYSYKPEALTAVYFGLKMDTIREDIISMILKERYPHVNIYRAKKMKKSFEVNFEELYFN